LSVQIVEYRSRVVAVIGSVERPGLYPLTRPRGDACRYDLGGGGPAKEAGRVVRVRTRRRLGAGLAGGGSATSAPVRLDLEALLHAPVDHGRGLNPRVRPGDVITVSPAGSVLVDGWSRNPARTLSLAGSR